MKTHKKVKTLKRRQVPNFRKILKMCSQRRTFPGHFFKTVRTTVHVPFPETLAVWTPGDRRTNPRAIFVSVSRWQRGPTPYDCSSQQFFFHRYGSGSIFFCFLGRNSTSAQRSPVGLPVDETRNNPSPPRSDESRKRPA